MAEVARFSTETRACSVKLLRIKVDKNMSNEIIGLSYAKIADRFSNRVGVTHYISNDSVITEKNNWKWLAPSMEAVKALKNNVICMDAFNAIYQTTILDNLDPNEVVARLFEEFGPNPVLIGFHKDSAQCHRSQLGQWITDGTSYIAKEVSEQSEVFGFNVSELIAKYTIIPV